MEGIYLAISMTSNCNLQCFYCKPTGESISEVCGTIPYESFCRITTAAYCSGITKFRLTGGECTLVPYFADAIRHLISLGDDTMINICSNAYRLAEHTDLITRYANRIHVRISVDSLTPRLGDFYFPKYLSDETKDLTKELVARGIETRFNIVVTSYNLTIVPELICESLALGVNLKLLDLYIQNVYLGGDAKPEIFWQKTYQSLTQFHPFLKSLCTAYRQTYWDDSVYGIPMGAYFYGKQSIILKDSSRGAHFCTYCREMCPFYQHCQEGIYVPFLSVGNYLHINGCHNKNLRWNLNDLSHNELKKAFYELLTFFDALEVRQRPSARFRAHNSFLKEG